MLFQTYAIKLSHFYGPWPQLIYNIINHQTKLSAISFYSIGHYYEGIDNMMLQYPSFNTTQHYLDLYQISVFYLTCMFLFLLEIRFIIIN